MQIVPTCGPKAYQQDLEEPGDGQELMEGLPQRLKLLELEVRHSSCMEGPNR